MRPLAPLRPGSASMGAHALAASRGCPHGYMWPCDLPWPHTPPRPVMIARPCASPALPLVPPARLLCSVFRASLLCILCVPYPRLFLLRRMCLLCSSAWLLALFYSICSARLLLVKRKKEKRKTVGSQLLPWRPLEGRAPFLFLTAPSSSMH